MNLRAPRRAVALGFALTVMFFRYWATRLRGPLTLEQRAEWMQFSGRIVLSSLGIHYRFEGQPPTRGIVVANHLSYLDIAIFSAVMKCFFVSKAEISKWPYFGKAALAGGTMFVERASIASAERVASEIGERLALPIPIIFFPEGTSTDGSSVKRFRSRLFEPAVRAEAPVTAAAIRYIFADGAEERDLCWFGDEAFLTHLWKALGTPDFIADIRFGEPRIYSDRRVAADQTREQVVAMRASNLVLR